MRLLLPLFASSFLFACESSSSVKVDDTSAGVDDTGTDDSAGIDTDSADTGGNDTSDTADSGANCTASIVSVTPADGSLDQALDVPVTVTLSAPVTTADVSFGLTPAATGVVSASEDGLTVTWTPTEALARETSYSVIVTACGDEVTSGFTTVGAPTAAPIVGRTYDVELDGRDLTWNSPSSTVASLLVGNIDTTSLLFMVEDASDTTIDLVAAGGYDARGSTLQYPCAPPIDFPEGDFSSNPRFDVGPLDASLAASGLTVPLYAFTVDGRFEADASAMRDVHVRGLIDVRDLGAATGFGDVCALLPAFGISCVDCPDGEAQCLELDVVDASAPWRSGVTLDAALDPASDPACN